MKVNNPKSSPPQWARRLLQWYCARHLLEEIQGDLEEEFDFQVRDVGIRKARLEYIRNVIGFIKPFAIKRQKSSATHNTMIRSYFKIGWRNLIKNKGYSFINIGGLVLGMSVAIVIGLWINDEFSYNLYYKNYRTISQLARKEGTGGSLYIDDNSNHFPIPLAEELRTNYPDLLPRVALVSSSNEHLVAFGEKKFSSMGMYVSPEFIDVFTFEFNEGSGAGFKDPNTIILTQSLARALFGAEEVVGKTLILDGTESVKVVGVFEDLPVNVRFADVKFFVPFNLLVSTNEGVRNNLNNWGDSSFEIFVQTSPGIAPTKISERIKNIYWSKIESSRPKIAGYELSLFLHPMEDWHLRSEWVNGIQSGGRIQQVWLFGMIGVFVLLLACINFMNLSTARSEKRSKEVGVRKTMGSLRNQLIYQFLAESFLIVGIAFVLSVGVVSLSIGWFNQLSNKAIVLPFLNPEFWIVSAIFIVITAGLSGSYPALYLSSFEPVKVLKGTFRAGKLATIPRKMLVTLQFTVSIVLVIGTIVVYRQVQYAQNRPVGYDKQGLIRISMNTPELYGKYNVLQKELLESGGAIGFAQSSSATTQENYFADNFEWDGKDQNRHQMAFSLAAVSYDYGKTIGWKFKSGRDFSRDFSTDNASIILNESAVKYMGLINPLGQTIKRDGNNFTIIGVIADMITESPYEPVRQSLYFLVNDIGPYITIRLNPNLSPTDAIDKIAPIFKTYNPASPFDYKFVDEEYGRKFTSEQRIGTLANFFAALAVTISCLGIFGLASFVAEQRTKEIGVRKILGASVGDVWRMLTLDFVMLVGIAFAISAPFAWYFMGQWLQQYQYRTTVSWWIILGSGMAAMIITIITVSFQAIKAALTNPVRTLRSE